MDLHLVSPGPQNFEKFWSMTAPPVAKITASNLGLHRISASASAKPKFGHFSQIRPNSASAKFLAEFGRRQCNCSAFS